VRKALVSLEEDLLRNVLRIGLIAQHAKSGRVNHILIGLHKRLKMVPVGHCLSGAGTATSYVKHTCGPRKVAGKCEPQSPTLFAISTQPLLRLLMAGGPRSRLLVMTARRTCAPSSTWGFLAWNSHPRTITLPPLTWSACRPSFFRSHCTKVQSLKPVVPLPASLAIWLHGPQKAQFTKRTL